MKEGLATLGGPSFIEPTDPVLARSLRVEAREAPRRAG